MTIRCYKYWAQPASRSDADLLIGQLRLAETYRRALVEIENRSRALQRALWAQPLRAATPWQRRAYFLVRELPTPRTAKAKRYPRAFAAYTILDAELRRHAASEDFAAWRDRIMAAHRAATRAARTVASAAGLHYGTYWTVEDSVSNAVRTTAWKDDLGHRPQQKVGAPIDANRKPRADALDGEDLTRFRLDHRDLYALGELIDGYRIRATAEFRGKSGQVRAKRLCRAQIRTGSNGRAPVWAALHVLMHRPLPPGEVTAAWAQRHFVGGRARWEIVVSVEMDTAAVSAVSSVELDAATVSASAVASAMNDEGRVVAVDIGWRRRDDGVRIAYWLDSAGAEGEVVIPEAVERRKRKSDDLRSIRDNHQNEIKVALHDWLTTNPGTWLDGELAYVAAWKRLGHFIRLERAWRDQRVTGDVAVYQLLVQYLKHDRHLHAWQGHNLWKMERQIRGRLDAWAHELCRHHGTIVIEAFSLTDIKEKDDVAGKIAAKSIQRLAPGEIRRALMAAASKYDGQIVKIDAAYTTITCAACGNERVFADPAKLVLSCEQCGFAEDQDRTACRNLLAASGPVLASNAQALAEGNQGVTKKKLGARRNRRKAKEDRSNTVE
jgi:hypothetical protein